MYSLLNAYQEEQHLNIVGILVSTIGGLGLFLFGMNIMSDGLRHAASNRIKNILSHLTKNRLIALSVGAGVTALIQSSSASTVLTVGFVNAGLLSLRQAVSVILGANIGTTFTAWIVSAIGKFKISGLALPAIGIGFYLYKFSKRKRLTDFGEIFLGFGILFLGLDIMKDAFGPVKESQVVVDLFTKFSTNPLLGVLVGAIFTMIVQSSSATIAIVQILAFNGVISFDSSIPLILGTNIGTTITVQIASIGTNINARRTANAHTLFNVLGVCIILPLVWIGTYSVFIQYIFPGEITKTNIMAHIAISHSMFNVINALIFMIFIDALVKGSTALAAEGKERDDRAPKLLEEHLIASPVLAMEQVILELTRMAEVAKTTVKSARDGFFYKNEKVLRQVNRDEEVLDDYQRAITQYLIKISQKHLATRESREYPILLHSVNDLEKIGDYAKNVVNYTYILIRQKLTIAEEGAEQIDNMFNKLFELFNNVIESLKARDGEMARRAIDIEDQIDAMKAECRIKHMHRLNRNLADTQSEMIVMDMSTSIEKMGDHLISIAKAVIKDLEWGKKLDITPAEIQP